MGRYHQGKFLPENVEKYKGDYRNITYRSNWEKQLLIWLDNNPNIKWYNSEDVVIRYLCRTDNTYHRYFMDFAFETTAGTKFLVEVKPFAQTQRPVEPKRKTKSYHNAMNTYLKNISKWEAAREFALKNDYEFRIWTENYLRKIGLKI